MLPKEKRLSRKNILEIRTGRNRVFQGKYFGLIYSHHENEDKFGIIISSKISKKAVSRNQVKRKLFEALERYPLKGGWYLFLAKKPVLEAEVEDFEKEIKFFEGKIK